MGQIELDSPKLLANKYVWLKSPDEDVRTLSRQVGDDVLRKVLLQAQAGQFGKRSWVNWNYRFGLARVPAERKLEGDGLF